MFEISIPLVVCTLAILLGGYCVLARFLPKWIALLVAAVKAGVPFLYFACVFERGGWTLFDDVRYYRVGAWLLDMGYRPWELILDPEAREMLESAAASRHTLYYAWNALAQWTVGPYYFSAVFFNVGLTFLAGVLLYKTLEQAGLSRPILRGTLVLHMLHWDYLSWTSLINVKETLVETLLLLSLYCIVRFLRGRRWDLLLVVAAAFLALFALRLYVPFLVISATGLWVLLMWQSPRKYPLLPLVGGLLLVLYAKVGAYDQEIYPHLLVVGGFRFLLTPQPWNITPEYSFLEIPMWLQWAFVVPMLLGAVRLWQTNRTCRLLVLTGLVFVAFYAVFPANQGPRHRVQMVGLFAMVEFYFVAELLALPGTLAARCRRQPSSPGTCTKVRVEF